MLIVLDYLWFCNQESALNLPRRAEYIRATTKSDKLTQEGADECLRQMAVAEDAADRG
jgi:hypothetical protein